MQNEQADKTNGSPRPPLDRVVVEVVTEDYVMADSMRELPDSPEERAARARAWDETVSELAAITDETDTDELWSEVLDNLRARAGGGGF